MANDIHVSPATSADAAFLAFAMRQADRDEVRATGSTPLEALERGLAESEVALSAFYRGELGAMFGVKPVWVGTLVGGMEIGSLWSLTSPAFERYPVAFCRASRVIVRQLLERWSVLGNLVDARYTAAHRFIRFLGGDIGDEGVAVGPAGQLFFPFHFRRHA